MRRKTTIGLTQRVDLFGRPWGIGIMPSGLEYYEKVLATRPGNLIAYWPLWEEAGAVADNMEGTAARDGAYVNVTLANGTSPAGKPCPRFNGTNACVDIFTANLNAAFNKNEGTIGLFVRAFNAGVWTDGTERYGFALRSDWTNKVQWRKQSAPDDDEVVWERHITGEIPSIWKILSTTDWFHIAIAWSVAGNWMKAYYDGLQELPTRVGVSAWVMALDATMCNIGCKDNAPFANGWNGWLSDMFIFDAPLSDSQILSLATV